MSIQALHNMTQATARVLPTRPSGDDFAARMKTELALAADAAGAGGLAPERAEELHQAAEQLVATTFIQPMLAKIREDPFKTELFYGGQAEEIFGQQLDTIYAERIVARADFAIVDAVYNSIADEAMKTHTVDRSA